MNRRHFMRKLVTAGVAAGAFTFENPLLPRVRLARAAGGKAVLLVYQRGGCDWLNGVVPYGDDFDYYRLRSTIGIAPPAGSGVTPPGTLMDTTPALELADLNASGYANFFGLHPSLTGLHSIYNNGDMAILPTVQYPNSSRSHFDSQHFIESSASDADRSNRDNLTGWAARHLETFAQPGQLRAVSFGNSVAQSLRGSFAVSSFNNIQDFNLGLPEDEANALINRLLGVYAETPSPGTTVQNLVHQTGDTALNNLDVISGLDPSYTPDNGAVYPSSGFGRQLSQIAQLFKAGEGLELATINNGGWDTHSEQGGGNGDGRQARRFADLANGLNAFYTDLGGFTPSGGLMNDMLVIIMTEFGRTSEQNASFGTDHGTAAAWHVIHRGVTGGLYLDGANGTGWPGLAEANLDRGRYLDWTVDYRDIFGEVLTRFMGNTDVSTVLRGHTLTPLNMLPLPA